MAAKGREPLPFKGEAMVSRTHSPYIGSTNWTKWEVKESCMKLEEGRRELDEENGACI